MKTQQQKLMAEQTKLIFQQKSNFESANHF